MNIKYNNWGFIIIKNNTSLFCTWEDVISIRNEYNEIYIHLSEEEILTIYEVKNANTVVEDIFNNMPRKENNE